MEPKDLTDYHLALQLFSGYDDADTGILREFQNAEAHPEPGFLTDFLGARIRSASVWKHARSLDGQLLGLPIPGDFHAETIEWIGLLKAVRGATDQYVAMELGAGFGPWTVAGGVAARRRGIQEIRLCAVEADPQHFGSLRQHFLDNGFDPGVNRLIHAAVGVESGVAHWPIMDDAVAGEEWGVRPMESQTDYTGRHFPKTRTIDVVSMRDLVVQENQWDLIHIDVQGHEVDICASCIDELNRRVRWIVVGLHSRKLDGDFLEMLYKAGWFLEHEKPTKFAFLANQSSLEAMTRLDGTQVWRNPRLTKGQGGGVALSSFSQEIACSVSHVDVSVGAVFTLPIRVTNTGSEPWFGGQCAAPVNASYRWLNSRGETLPIEGNRAELRNPMWPGDHTSLDLEVLAPPQNGSYTLVISMVQESVAWFLDRGATPLAIAVVVR